MIKRLKRKFVFVEDEIIYFGNFYSLENLKNNDYINSNENVFIYNNDLKLYLDDLEDNSNTLDDYKRLLKRNCLDNDLNYVRNAYIFDLNKSLTLGYEIDNVTLVENNNYFEFVYGESTNIVRDFSSLRLIDNRCLDYAFNYTLHSAAFTNLLNSGILGDDFKFSLDEFDGFQIYQDENDDVLYKINYDNNKSILIRDSNLMQFINDLGYDMEVLTSSDYDGIDNFNKDKESFKYLINFLKDIRTQFLEESPKYLDNDIYLNSFQMLETILLSKTPMDFAFNLCKQQILNIMIDKIETDIGIPNCITNLMTNITSEIITSSINGELAKAITEEASNNIIKDIAKEEVKKASFEESFKKVPFREDQVKSEDDEKFDLDF